MVEGGSPGFSQVTHAELVAQVIRIGDELKQLQLDNATLNAQITDLFAHFLAAIRCATPSRCALKGQRLERSRSNTFGAYVISK